MSFYLSLKSLPELKRRMWRERNQACWQMGMKPLGHVSVWLAMAITCAVLLWAADTLVGNLVLNANGDIPLAEFEQLMIVAGVAAVAAWLFYRHVYLAAMRQYVGYAAFDRSANPLFAWLKSLLVPVVSIVFIVCGMLALDWAINSFDADPIPAVAELKQWPDPVPEESNGFLAAAGLMAPLKQSPFRAGQEWVDATNEATQKQTGKFPAQPSGLQYISYEQVHGKEPGGESSVQFCRPGQDDCLARLKKESKDAQAWVAANKELLSRYLSLRKYPQWQDSLVPGDPGAPLLQLIPLVRGQNLMQVSALLALDKKQTYRGLLMISDDIAFLRKVLASKNGLVMQMIASAMLSRDYALLGELLVERPDALKTYGWMPEKMLTPLTVSELSLRNALRFEEKAMVRLFEKAPMSVLLSVGKSKTLGKAWGEHHVKRIATLNLVLRLQARQIKRLTVNSASYTPPFSGGGGEGPPLFSRRTGFVYNIGGKLISVLFLTGYHDYANRQADLNAFNRLVRLRLALAAKKLAPEDVPAFLADKANVALLNPETGKPFDWDAHSRKVYFTPASPYYRQYFNFGDRLSGRVGLSVPAAKGKQAKKPRRKG